MKFSGLIKINYKDKMCAYKSKRNKYFTDTQERLYKKYGIDVVEDVILSETSKIVCFADLKEPDSIVLEVVYGNLELIGFEDRPSVALAEILEVFDFKNGYAKVAGESQYFDEVYNQIHNFKEEPNVTFPIITAKGKQWIRFNLVLLEGKKDLATVFITNVTPFLVEEEALFFKTHHDSLTSLFNKYTLDYHYGIRYKQKNFHVLFLDLDNFKVLNDKLGHKIGDEFLKKFARILSLHETDHNRFYRIGGDEFVGLFYQKESQIVDVAKSILRKTRALSKNYPVETTVSIGVVKADLRDNVIEKADQVLYDVKAQGKNAFIYKDESKIKL